MGFPSIIKVSVLSGEPIFVFNKTHSGTSVWGIEGKFLEILASKLNFQYEIISPEDGKWGSLMENGTWSGIIGMVARGEVDMGLTYLAIMEDRSKVVDFSTPYYSFGRTFVTDKPGISPKYAVFLYPFSLNVWILFLIFLVISPYILQKWISAKRPVPFRLPDAVEEFLQLARRNESFQKTIVRCTRLISITFITFIYSSVLLSFILVPLHAPGISNFQELSSAVQKGKMKCLVPKGSVDVQLLKDSNALYLKKLGKLIAENDWSYQSRELNSSEAIGRNLALIGPRLILQCRYGVPPFTTKFISDDSIVEMSTAIALKKNFCCRNKLDGVILRMVSGGLFQKLVNDKLFETRAQMLSSEFADSEEKPLALEDVFGIFLFLIVSYVASFVLLIGEILHDRYSKCIFSKVK
ncbi:lig_chan-Glu_bd domain-containing protein [Caerostris darwini]|uniref:Lig_chan-Glu_bd domain-containing protein n=1 Tax=Caerostris darwini TaxID=1538125 RepID=A0AAV4NKK7_9ARAC|nr:lig_chan-Glu_bd domain-containing protein [Caerostris darwini]